jgi:hypothetical protein
MWGYSKEALTAATIRQRLKFGVKKLILTAPPGLLAVGAWSKNSCGRTMVVYQQAVQPCRVRIDVVPEVTRSPFFFANLFASVRELNSKVGDDLTVKGGVSW